jgi:pimeloyl-ACP methyl ester carboxylesterase
MTQNDDEPTQSSTQKWRDLRITVRDGLSLYGRHYPAPGSSRRPVLCLAGLTRNSRDFHVLAEALSCSNDAPRPVYTLDFRGRGRSDFSRDWKDYSVPVEAFDVQDFMASQHLHAAGIVGTSRGGIVAMVLAAIQPSLLGPVVLNDIGPVIDMEGLVRISGYVGRMPLPRSWPEAAKLIREANQSHFTAVPDDLWETVARQWFNEKNGRPAAGYDPKIAKSFSLKDGAIPELWPQFEALKRHPVLVLRGSNSDLLSEKTIDEMKRRHPRCDSFTVEGQGHAPILHDAPSIHAIRSFFGAHDGASDIIAATNRSTPI